jgi:hypothetical protein
MAVRRFDARTQWKRAAHAADPRFESDGAALPAKHAAVSRRRDCL